MPRKRKTTPNRMTDEKRKCLSWNMFLTDDSTDKKPTSSNVQTEKEPHNVSDPFSLASIPHENVQSTEVIQQEALHPHEISLHMYKELWDDADYSITILDKPPQKSIFKIGTFTIQLSLHSLLKCGDQPTEDQSSELPRNLPSHNKFSLFAISTNVKREFYIVFDTDSSDENVNYNGPYICFDAHFRDEIKDRYIDGLEFICRFAKGKHFSVTKGGYCHQKSLLDLDVWITDLALKKPKFGAESSKITQSQKSVQSVMEWLQGIHVEEIGSKKKQRQDFDEVFSFVRQFHKEEEKKWVHSIEGVQHKNLVPKLREYQKEAVEWMISKEKLNENTKENELHCLWRQLDDKGTPLYYNADSGIFTQIKFLQPQPFPGGILADEMGLGKTVEVLALMLNHKRSFKTQEICETIEKKQVEPSQIDAEKNELSVESSGDADRSNNENVVDGVEDVVSQLAKPTNVKNSGDVIVQPEHLNRNLKQYAGTGEPMIIGGESVKIGQDSCPAKPVITGESGNTCTVESGGTGDPSAEELEPEPQVLQCLCGVKEDVSDLVVQCVRCKVWQHTKCVNMDTSILDKEDYHCPHCWSLMDAVKSSATLIITPAAICHQWVDEINRHINLSAIKMLIYQGVKKHGYIQPKELASYDIVITTYDKLGTELNYVDLPHTNDQAGRRLRHAKRYMATPTPLPCVEWWRVCLDEAQMIESPTAKSAAMALRLKAVNRWCVTGTPIQKSMDDLYGLFLFIGIEPYWVKCWWEQLLCRPFYFGKTKPIQEAVAKVLWRTSKKDVINQIQLPPQTEERHWLKFSPVEQHFYKKQHSDCRGRFIKAFNQLKHADLNTKLCDVDRDTVQKLLFPLLRLRQACCHPQAVRGQFITLQKEYLTMDQLLTSLQEKAKIESEECHRQLVCALNGLAAIHTIKFEISEAVEKYREVLRSSQEFKDKLRTDKLQLYHAMFNLRKLLDTKPKGVHPTLQDDQLQTMACEIYDGYMAKALVKVKSSEDSLRPVQEKIHSLTKKVPVGCTWWLDAIHLFQNLDLDEEIIKKVKTDLGDNTPPGVTSLADRFRDMPGLQFLLVRHLDLLVEKRTAVCKAVDRVNCDPKGKLLQQCIECHLRPYKGEEQKICPFCEADKLFDEYEIQLFAFHSSSKAKHRVCRIEDEGIGSKRPRGTWAMSEVERILRILLSYCKNVDDDELEENGTIHVEMIESYRKEFKLLRAVWMALLDRVASMDELEMSTMRLRIRMPWEPADPSTENYVIEPGQEEQHRYKLLNDRALATNGLRKKLSQQLYLSNLATADYAKQGHENPEQCPICVSPLGSQWTVLQCGHCFCYECIEILAKNYSSIGRQKSIKCPTCRASTLLEDISYVSTKLGMNGEGENEIKVKGGHSTKVEAIIRTLLTIQMKQPGAKSIVFSTWTDVLEVIAHGLRDNNIEYRLIQYGGHPQFQSKLMDFKHDKDVTTLLLPVQSGAKGLNIIEATHVLLVEPILNVANELQAIGRVHRIGQTKPTVVHRFLIQNTIEERMHAMLQATHNVSVDSTELELGGLSLSDLRDIFSDIQPDYDQDSGLSTSGTDSMAVIELDDVPSTSTTIPDVVSSNEH